MEVLVPVLFLVENNKLKFNHQVDISRTKGAKPRIRLEMRIRLPARYVWFTRYLVLVVASVSFPSLCMSWEAEGKSTNYRATPPDSRSLHGKPPLGDEASRGFRDRYRHDTVVGKPVLVSSTREGIETRDFKLMSFFLWARFLAESIY